MNGRILDTSVAMAVAIVLSGCADAHRVEVATVLQNGNCQTNTTGVHSIDYPTLANYRGTRLIGMTESSTAADAPLQLIAIVPAEFPTPGYKVSLTGGSERVEGTLTLRITIQRPAAGVILAQMTTHPCLVVGIADTAVDRVRVIDEGATVIGEVVLPNKADS